MSDRALMLTQVAATLYPEARKTWDERGAVLASAEMALALYRAVSDALDAERPVSRELPACTCMMDNPRRRVTTVVYDCPRHGPDRSTGEGDER